MTHCLSALGWTRQTAAQLVCLAYSCLAAYSATYTENFSANPLANGWNVFGNPQLFHWNNANQNLEVTWDSSQTNSYFRLPLGTILSKQDDFEFSLDLRLDDIAIGTNPNKPWTFELAFGLQNSRDAAKGTFVRGSAQAPNLVEFDYFPDSGFGATVWPAFVSSNNVFNFDWGNPLTSYTIIALPTQVWMHVALSYQAASQTLSTTITTNGVPFGPIGSVQLLTNFTDFRVDMISITSYSDAGADGSLLAHGVVDNVRVTVPEAPIAAVTGGFINQVWQLTFGSRTNWVYAIEHTADFHSWNNASAFFDGTGGRLTIPATSGAGYYRVKAERP